MTSSIPSPPTPTPPIPSPIAIDGPAAAGKGTLARALATHFNFAHLDTGMLYRHVAYLVLQASGNPDNEADSLQAVQKLQPFAVDEKSLRTNQIAAAAAKVAAQPQLRAKMLDLQRNFATHPPNAKAGAVLEGRDIGTIICPAAPIKLFITAQVEIRAHRRWLELKQADPSLQEAQVLAALQARDKKDFSRPVAPLKQAANALLLDTSNLAIKDVFKAALTLIEQKALEIQTAQNID